MKYQYKVLPSEFEDVKRKLSRIAEYKDLGDNTVEVETDDLTLVTAIKCVLEVDEILVSYSQVG
ncbi:MAG: hypothetical protein KME49_27450 [Brasilonema octagenarum HA4186-MV1]|jgi:hypothetical protein|nr:hypothetical protein [Brasilonema octagenarum HA4186-MV1]